MGALPGLPSTCSKAGARVIPQFSLPGAGGACKRVVLARASAPPPGWGGGGEEEGADGSNYGLDLPPPVAGGRKTGSLRFRERAGGEAALAAHQPWGARAQAREGTFFPWERAGRFP